MSQSTERLYYHDSFLYEFAATIVEVVPGERRAVILDRTAFYPTSGGQPFDSGYLEGDSGERVRVVEVAEAEDGRILHFVEAPLELEKGTRVRGRIDAWRRRDHMQQHSGQHMLSAAFVRLFDLATVSFHLGDDLCTIDLGTRTLAPAQLEQASRLANQVVTDDRPVEIRFADVEEARALGVRKLPELGREKLRLIEIRDFDLTACGGTHVRSTGQIGAILLRKTETVRQNVRVEFVCGERAVTTAQRDYAALTKAAALYSTHVWEVPQQVCKSQEDLKAAAKAQQRLLEELAEFHAARLLAETPASGGAKRVVRRFADRDLNFVKLLAQKIAAAGPAVALLASSAGPPTLVFCQTPGLPFHMGTLLQEALAAVGGRGGGGQDFAQGGVPDATRLDEVLQQASNKLQL